MRYGIFINQVMCIKWGITGKKANAAHVFAILHESSSWAEETIIYGQVFYWTSRQAICEELSYLQLKPDTVYRHLKFLEDKGLIEYVKKGKKDCIRITSEGKKWNKIQSKSNPEKFGSKSDYRKQIRANSDLNPKKLGSKSENDSDLNPTYQSTIVDQNTIDQNTTDHLCAREKSKSFDFKNQNSKKEPSPPPQKTIEFPARLIKYLEEPGTPDFFWDGFDALYQWLDKIGKIIDFSSRMNGPRNIDLASTLFNLLLQHRKIPADGSTLSKAVTEFLDNLPTWFDDKIELALIVSKFDRIFNEQHSKKNKKHSTSSSKLAEQWKY